LKLFPFTPFFKVNNAGIIDRGGAETTPLSVLDDLMDVNVKRFFCEDLTFVKNLIKSLIRLTQLAVPYLEKTKGSIVNGYLIIK